ncbi:MAG: PQQ-binding-like beta-propeller repeat protein [Planctomycetes bacterium]|nr:PQQ-binding-like beta-propeller repeat protein [Planctomycetota bacterium]
MALRGDLASVDLAQVFQMLALNKKVGLLSIQSAKSWKVLYFDNRGVTVHHNIHRVLDRVVAGLVRAGRLTDSAVDEVRDHAARMGQPLTDSLLAGGYLAANELADQYRIELEEEIYDLFFCRDARFEFHEGTTKIEGRDGAIDERFFFNCDSVIMEAARRIDEWAYISERIPTTAEVLVATAATIDGEEYGADGVAVFELLDGRRNIARIVETTGLSTFQVCKSLSQMLDAGLIAPVAAEELLPLAAECMTTGRLQDAISLYERAVTLGVGIPQVHSLAATAYQAAEEYENAVYHLECEAEHRLGSGDSKGAAQKLFEAKQVLPTNLRARERLVELTLGVQGVAVPGFDPLAEGKELVDLLIEFGDIQRVRGLLERLLLVEPNDPDLKKALVNVHVKAGDQKRVAELYESIADDLVRQSKPLEAVAYLQKVLLIDRSRSDVSERVRKLYEFDERVRRRGRNLGILAVAFCMLLVLGVGYWFYNQRAEEEFTKIDARELVAHEDFAGASALYQDFASKHPLTTAVAKAEGELQQIEAARLRFEARRESERASRQRDLERAREEYKAAWAKHRELFLAGHPEDSMVSLNRVRELLASAAAAEDVAWALENQVERTWVKLRDHLAEARRLAESYDALMAEGKWQDARELALRLHSEFDSTQDARRVRVPVMVDTRPSGAALVRNGVPMERVVDGKSEVLRTPSLVLVPFAERLSLVAMLDGFTPRDLAIDGKTAARMETVLEVIAHRRITFPTAVQTGVGIGEGWIAVGLRGGRLGVARSDGTSVRAIEMAGLKAVDSTPVVQNGRIFFTTNENTLECVPIDTSLGVAPWTVAVRNGFATELMVGEGRLACVDRENVLSCWEQASGALVWSVSLDATPSGPPTIDRRQVSIGTVDGRALRFDATDGKPGDVLRSESPLTTRILADRGVLYFGSADASIKAVTTEGRVLWSAPMGRNLADGELALSAKWVLAIDRDGSLVAIDRSSGAVTAKLPLQGTPQRGLHVQGPRVLLQLRRKRERSQPAHDVLQAVQADQLVLQWEYADQGYAPGAASADDFLVALPAAGGEVILFR